MQRCINIENVVDTCDLTDPYVKLINDNLPEVEVYLPEQSLYIRRVSYGEHSHNIFYVIFNILDGSVTRVTTHVDYQEGKLIPIDNKQYQSIVKMVSHPKFNEYLDQLELYQNIGKYLKQWKNVF